MKALIFGSKGMLGSALRVQLERVNMEVSCSTTDITRLDSIEHEFREVRPDVAINCAGIVKSECHDRERAIAVNARAPHVLAGVAWKYSAKFVQVSTDCVFNGRGGNYCESDPTDAEDLYGQTKVEGEITDREDCLTIRTSFIGYDVRRRRGLLEWLLSQHDVVFGHNRAFWSGLSAPELSRAILLGASSGLYGLYHVTGPVVSKADLLEVLVRELGLACRVERIPDDVLDRTLNGSRFVAATGYIAPDWAHMARELKSNA